MACLACQSQEHVTFSSREMMFGMQERFDYRECCDCGSLQIAEVPANLGDYYPASYYSFAQGAPRAASARSRLVAAVTYRLLFLPIPAVRKQVAARRPHSKMANAIRLGLRGGDRIVDVGSGAGDLVQQLAEIGFPEPMGIDPFIAGDIRYESGAHIRKCELADLDGRFDVVMFNHALEHVADPNQDLRKAAELLNDGGRCVVRIPTSSSEAFRTYRADWVQLDPPRHLFIPSRDGMIAMAAANGLRIVSVEDDSSVFQFAGSEQYRRDLPLWHDGTLGVRQGVFSDAQMRDWEKRSDEVNARGDGDQSIFIFEKAR